MSKKCPIVRWTEQNDGDAFVGFERAIADEDYEPLTEAYKRLDPYVQVALYGLVERLLHQAVRAHGHGKEICGEECPNTPDPVCLGEPPW